MHTISPCQSQSSAGSLSPLTQSVHCCLSFLRLTGKLSKISWAVHLLSESPWSVLNKGTVNSKQPYLLIECILSMYLQDIKLEEALKMLW